MKNNYSYFLILIIYFLPAVCLSQVGVGTNSPNGALEINSSISGFVYPNVSLTNTATETIINPNAPNIVAGTTVYNTATVNNGTSSVYPGIYIWDGTEWIPQFNKNDYKLFEQNTDLRTQSNPTIPLNGKQTISFDSNIFTPKYNGDYKIKLTVHYGGGEADPPNGTSQFANFVAASGEYEFICNGTSSTFNLKSFSGNNDDRLVVGTGSINEYFDQYKQTSLTREEMLTANTDYTFSLTFNQDDLPGIQGDGDVILGIPLNTDGYGYISQNQTLKCTVEFEYIGN